MSRIDKIKEISSSQYDALYEISQKLNSADYSHTLFEEALDTVIAIINAERGLFVKYDETDQNFTIVAARNIKKENLTDITKFSSGILNKVIENRRPFLYHDVQSDPQLSQYESIQIQNINSVLGVPILKNDEIKGVILVDSRSHRKEFSEENLAFLSFFSNLVSLALDRVDKFEKLQDRNQMLVNQLQATERLPNMVGNSEAIRKTARLIHKVAASEANVLILGESGTGKELVSRAIHKLSGRSEQPFLAQFCGSIPDNLLESELFGYKKGAFTGAASDKKGLLEVADGGTFFLDEIADISSALQAKLLRVLENHEIMRLGDTSFTPVNVRIIAATNKNLQEMAKEGTFREDLFYRLNVFPVTLPPLRERREDIAVLVKHFISLSPVADTPVSAAAIRKLENYYWPGNIRQLSNVIQRALILSEYEKIEPEHIILEEENDLDDFQGTLKDFELRLLKKRLKQFNGNRTNAAKSLGVSVRWVQNKIKELE